MRFVLALLFVTLCRAELRLVLSVSPQARSSPVDGRIILILSRDALREPRDSVSWGLPTQQIFGMDVDQLTPGKKIRLPADAIGHPLRALAEVPPGRYNAQAVLNVYETVRRADGHVLKLPMDDGEGQRWNRSPGNLYSKPQMVDFGPDASISIEMTEVIPPIAPPKDTKYVRHVGMQSELLTAFWGRPVYLSAIVIVPPGFDEHPDRRYPVAFKQGHFSGEYFSFRESPPSPSTTGEARRRAEAAWRFHQDWDMGRLPAFLLVQTQHATPFYDDSYGVNSANMGPYGDALTEEFYPLIEKRFRAIGEPRARILFGGSTGGWMALAQQIFYPEYFGGTWGFCPDPVDFHAFQTINVYSDTNAYFDRGPFQSYPKLAGRAADDKILMTMEDFSRQEYVLGERGRSGGQMDAFHATFGPVGKDGYPAPLGDPRSGAIDPEVARYWRQHFDLTALLRRDWERLGPRLTGKIHVTMGTKDTFYLDAAARRMEEFLESTRAPGKGPYYGGSFIYGEGKPHCWSGNIPEGQTAEAYYLPIFARQVGQGSAGQASAPDRW